MDYIYAWLSTIILSAGVSIANELRMYKDAADAGYKINGRNLNNYSKEYQVGTIKNMSLALLIPFYNIIHTTINLMAYNLNRKTILDNLSMLDALEDMTEEEKKEYQKFPTGLHALIIMIKEAIRLSKLNCMKIKTAYDTSEIYFDITDDNDIEIVKVYGSLSRATRETQKEKVLEAFYGIAMAGIEVYGNDEEFIKAINENANIDLNKEYAKMKTNQEQIEELEELKEELLSQVKPEEQKESSHKTRRRKK